MASSIPSDGLSREIAGAYVEFVERLALVPSNLYLFKYASYIPPDVKLHVGGGGEVELRDGFEAGNADKIFQSTTLR